MSMTSPVKFRPGRACARHSACVAVGFIAAICGLHVYWALGGRWAADRLNAGAEAPPRGVIWLVAALLAAAALMLLGRAGMGWARELPDGLLHAGAWMIAATFWLGALGNLTSGDMWSMAASAPVSAAVAVLATIVAVRRRDEAAGAPRQAKQQPRASP